MTIFLSECVVLCACQLNICSFPQAADDDNGKAAKNETQATEQKVQEVLERTLEKHFVTLEG